MSTKVVANSLQVEQKHTLLDCVNCLQNVFWSCVSQNTWPPVVAKYTTSRWVWDVKVLGVFGRDLSFRRKHVQSCAPHFALRSFRLIRGYSSLHMFWQKECTDIYLCLHVICVCLLVLPLSDLSVLSSSLLQSVEHDSRQSTLRNRYW